MLRNSNIKRTDLIPFFNLIIRNCFYFILSKYYRKYYKNNPDMKKLKIFIIFYNILVKLIMFSIY